MPNFSITDIEGRSTVSLHDLLDWRKSTIAKIDNMISRGDHSSDDFKQTLIEDMQLIQIILASR